MKIETYNQLTPQQKAIVDLLVDIRREVKRMADLLEAECSRN